MNERTYLLTRCLRLEAKIAQLQSEMTLSYQHRRRNASPDDRARMIDMRRRGASVRAIAQQTGWSQSLVYLVTRNIHSERESSE